MTNNAPPAGPPRAPGPDPDDDDRLALRFVVISLLALITAVATGVLYWMGTTSVPMAIIAGGGAFAGSWILFDRWVR